MRCAGGAALTRHAAWLGKFGASRARQPPATSSHHQPPAATSSQQQPPPSRQKNCVRVTAAPRSPAHRARELCNQRAVRRAPCTAGWMMWPAFRLGNIFPTFNISQHTAQNTTPRCVDTMGIDFINSHTTISRIIKIFYFFTITNPAFIFIPVQ